MDEINKQQALEQAKQMFDKFDIDDANHSAIIVMYDKKESAFRMLTINVTPSEAMMLLDNAVDSVIDNVSDAIKYRNLN